MNTQRIALIALVALFLAPLSIAADTQRAPAGMVVSEHWLASEVGRDVLIAGGNAVDAAIATGFALAVTHPAAGNIGGGGFMVIRFPDGTSTAIDFRETAPAAAHPRMWLDEATGQYSSRRHHYSHKAVGVPGTVAGFDKAHRLYGSAPWKELVEPAAHLATAGFVLSEPLAASLGRFVERFAHYEATVAQFSQGGTPYAAGDTLRQPDLARTLRRIQTARRDGFYTGETARLIVEEMERGGGLITLEDLTRYQARERQPIRGTYRGYEILSMPPPSSGGVAIVTMLNILEAWDLTGMGHNSPLYIHHLAEAMRRAFRDRAQWLADVDLVDVPIHRLTSKRHAAELRRTIDPHHASVSSAADLSAADLSRTDESPETTHYSVVDADGIAVAVTYTLEASYGSGIVVPGGGFLLNNEMGDFNAAPGLTDEHGLIGTTPNLARPGQRMLSSMSPTILSKDGELVAVLGSPGGRTIINTVLQLILNLVDFEMTIDEAVAAPRVHHQWLPDRIRLEADRFDDPVVIDIEALGHRVQVRGRQGSAHSIGIEPATGQSTYQRAGQRIEQQVGTRIGATDPRGHDAGARGH